MILLGLDPGLKATGYGFIHFQKGELKLIECGTIEPKPKDPIQYRIEKIYSILEELVYEHKPQALILEKLYAHSKHPMTGIIMGHLRGVICLLCAQQKIDLVEHSVKRIRKAITGNGNATKQQTRSLVANALNIDEKKLTLDASDALALALGFTHIHKSSLLNI